MQNGTFKLAGVMAGLGLAASAFAAPTISITKVKNPPISDSFGDTATGYTAYQVTVTADSGDVIGSIVAGNTPGSTQGFSGPFLQQWEGRGTPAPTPFETAANSTGNSNQYSTDTHWLIDPSTSIIAGAEIEDNNQVQPAGAPASGGGEVWGSGTYLRGTLAPNNATTANSLAIAYLVLPTSDTSATYSIGLTENNATTLLPDGGQINLTGSIDGTGTPEPTSLAVLGLGGLGLMSRRRVTA